MSTMTAVIKATGIHFHELTGQAPEVANKR